MSFLQKNIFMKKCIHFLQPTFVHFVIFFSLAMYISNQIFFFKYVHRHLLSFTQMFLVYVKRGLLDQPPHIYGPLQIQLKTFLPYIWMDAHFAQGIVFYFLYIENKWKLWMLLIAITYFTWDLIYSFSVCQCISLFTFYFLIINKYHTQYTRITNQLN